MKIHTMMIFQQENEDQTTLMIPTRRQWKPTIVFVSIGSRVQAWSTYLQHMRVNKSTKGHWVGWKVRISDWEAKLVQSHPWVGRNKIPPREKKGGYFYSPFSKVQLQLITLENGYKKIIQGLKIAPVDQDSKKSKIAKLERCTLRQWNRWVANDIHLDQAWVTYIIHNKYRFGNQGFGGY